MDYRQQCAQGLRLKPAGCPCNLEAGRYLEPTTDTDKSQRKDRKA